MGFVLLSSFGDNVVHLRPFRYHNMSGTVVNLLEYPTDVLCSNPVNQTKGHHVPLDWCGRKGSGPVLDGVPMACFELFFLWLWLV